MPITTTLDKVRLVLGDTDSTNPLFNDDELNYFIGERGTNVNLAAADALDALANRFAFDVDGETDGQKLARSQKSKAYTARAKELRARANGISVATVTRTDGYSDDVSNRDGAGQTPQSGHVRRGYYDGDLPH